MNRDLPEPTGASTGVACDARKTSPEFTPEYEQHQHFLRVRLMPSAPKSKPRTVRQKKLKLRTVKRIEVVQMADMPRYHYEVWAEFDDGYAEFLHSGYVHGLRNAVRLAIEKWGPGYRIDLCRWSARKHLPLLDISACRQIAELQKQLQEVEA